MNILMNAWSYFATNILQQPAWMIGLIVLIGYILLKKPWYDVLGGTLKAIIGYMILAVGSSGLVNNFRPVLVGLNERFNLDAMVIDPYFGQNAVTVGVAERFGKSWFALGRLQSFVLYSPQDMYRCSRHPPLTG